MWDADRIKDAEARFRRFEKLFRVQIRIWELVNMLLDQETVRLRSGAERDLSLVVGASLGKAMKTFQGVHELCLTGWGEDAMILLRSNVNLLINLGFILGDQEPVERAHDFIAFSYLERVKYLKTAHGAEKPPWRSQIAPEELDTRAQRWKSVNIRERAERVQRIHYTTGYAFYSSIEHSDAMALNGYIAEWDEVGPRINAGPNDDHIEVTLGHNAIVLADVLGLCCRHFDVGRPDFLATLNKLLESVG